MDKKLKSNKNYLVGFRGCFQATATLLTNLHIPNLFKGKLYQGKLKTICAPGLNCYSCPSATGACPIGAFQAVVGSSKIQVHLLHHRILYLARSSIRTIYLRFSLSVWMVSRSVT